MFGPERWLLPDFQPTFYIFVRHVAGSDKTNYVNTVDVRNSFATSNMLYVYQYKTIDQDKILSAASNVLNKCVEGGLKIRKKPSPAHNTQTNVLLQKVTNLLKLYKVNQAHHVANCCVV